MLRKIKKYILSFNKKNSKYVTSTYKSNELTEYEKKPLMTYYEKRMYNTIKKIGSKYTVIPQLNLATIIRKRENKAYCNELFRNIDFAIFDKDLENILLLIEINDKSHNEYKRRIRDLKVKKICDDAGIRLINFYTNYPNEEHYVINRILKEIKKCN